MVLGVDIGETATKVNDYRRGKGLTYPTVVDLNARVPNRYGVSGHPNTVIIDREGRLIAYAVGPREWMSPRALSYFKRLTAEAGT